MMRKDVRTIRDDQTLAQFRRAFPLGATQRVIVVDQADRYAGIVFVSDAHRETAETVELADLIRLKTDMLLPNVNIREAMKSFATAESDVLAVVDGSDRMRVIGLLTEQHALKRYNEELDGRLREGGLL
ncbi:CBS domain-containing protein [Azospirillum melinis]|uniref:CBS domain-containing protein n=1 Tax=Azospirillum melinis TaxID=328839 RepID=UPI003756D2C1